MGSEVEDIEDFELKLVEELEEDSDNSTEEGQETNDEIWFKVLGIPSLNSDRLKLVENLSKPNSLVDVLLCQDKQNEWGSVVARRLNYLKKIVTEDLDSIDFEQRDKLFGRQKLLQDIEHQNIARVYGTFMDGDGTPYIVREYIRGTSLDELMKRKAFTVEEVKEVLLDVAKGARELNNRNVIHRDLKPSNIIITDQSNQKSKAVITDHDDISESVEMGGGSTCFVRKFTKGYTPPEAFQGIYTPAWDVYSLGVLGIELLTRRDCLDPYIRKMEGSTPHYNFTQFCRMDDPEVRELCDMLQKMVEPDYQKRMQNMEEVISLLSNEGSEGESEKVDGTTHQEHHEVRQKAKLPKVKIIQGPGDPSQRRVRGDKAKRKKRVWKGAMLLVSLALVGTGSAYVIRNTGVENHNQGFFLKTLDLGSLGTEFLAYDYSEDREFCGLVEDNWNMIVDNDCDASADAFRYCEVGETCVTVERKDGDMIDSYGRKLDVTSFDNRLRNFYSEHDLKDEIFQWKKDHLVGGILKNVTSLDYYGFLVNKDNTRLNYSGYVGGCTPAKSETCFVREELDKKIKTFRDDGCDGSVEIISGKDGFGSYEIKHSEIGDNKKAKKLFKEAGEKVGSFYREVNLESLKEAHWQFYCKTKGEKK